MQLQYDDDLVEGAVFVTAKARSHSPSPLQVRRFHRAREKCYDILDPDERNAAFFKVHFEWFREWGLENLLLGSLDEFPLLRTALTALVFRRARIKKDEGAELYVSVENGRAGVLALRVEQFAHLENLACLLRHEFSHLHDMVNPSFGYAPQFHLPGRNPFQQRLIRERYRLLWDITIDGRLAAASRTSSANQQQHRASFDRAFEFWSDEKRAQIFLSLWENPEPRHDALLAIASDPRDLQASRQPLPGAPCPLCGFATFAWTDVSALTVSITTAIAEEFPNWTAPDGCCQRCAAIYNLRSSPSLAIA